MGHLGALTGLDPLGGVLLFLPGIHVASSCGVFDSNLTIRRI